MPEGPEMRRAGKTLVGRRVLGVETRGKAMLTHFDHGITLYSHNQLYGLWATAELEHHPLLARLGPDIMNSQLHWRDIAARLREAPFCRRELAALYLDQGFLAGIGNYLRFEILHDAGIFPRARPAAFSRAEIGRLARTRHDSSYPSRENPNAFFAPYDVSSGEKLLPQLAEVRL